MSSGASVILSNRLSSHLLAPLISRIKSVYPKIPIQKKPSLCDVLVKCPVEGTRESALLYLEMYVDPSEDMLQSLKDDKRPKGDASEKRIKYILYDANSEPDAELMNHLRYKYRLVPFLSLPALRETVVQIMQAATRYKKGFGYYNEMLQSSEHSLEDSSEQEMQFSFISNLIEPSDNQENVPAINLREFLSQRGWSLRMFMECISEDDPLLKYELGAVLFDSIKGKLFSQSES